MLSRLIIMAAAISVGVAVAVTVAACSGEDLKPRVAQVETSQAETAAQLQKALGELQKATKELEELHDSVTKAQLMASLQIIDTAGFHGMDQDLQKATEINPQYLGVVRKVQRVVAGTSWPDSIKDKAEAFKADLADFEKALADNNLIGAKAAAAKAHTNQHGLSDAAWPLVAGPAASEHRD